MYERGGDTTKLNAAYHEAFSISQEERIVPKDCKIRRVKYLNDVIEHVHRFIKKKVRALQYLKSFTQRSERWKVLKR
jgi:transposase-like protein